MQGVGIEKDQGRIRVWRLGGLLGQGLGYSLTFENFYFSGKIIWQIILENGDDCLGKTFPTTLAK